MHFSILITSSAFASKALAIPTAVEDETLSRRNPARLVARKEGWGVPSWGGGIVGGAVVGGAVTTGVNNMWQGIKNVLGTGSDSTEGRPLQDTYEKNSPYWASSQAAPVPLAQSNGVPYSAGNYAPPYPQANNGPQWQQVPQPHGQPQESSPGHSEEQNRPKWVWPTQSDQQKGPSPPAEPAAHDEKEPATNLEDIDPYDPLSEDPKIKPVSMSLTLGAPVVCRKFPDNVISSSWSQNVYAGGSKVYVNCWTTASMPGDLGKVEKSPVWLKTDRGCYISESATDDRVDFQAKLPFCVSPTHWAATARPEYEANLECYQCPTLKCPKTLMSKSTTVDVQCLVDGEEARGNSTWVKPIDQTCFLPGDIFTKGGWLGTPGGKC